MVEKGMTVLFFDDIILNKDHERLQSVAVLDYFTVLKNIEKYSLDLKKEAIWVKGLASNELESLRR